MPTRKMAPLKIDQAACETACSLFFFYALIIFQEDQIHI